MRTFVVGTAGHVDHGKTTLVRALTGVDTDRLPEEKRRGVSIELGFAPLALEGARASVVDVPGHRKFVPAMIAGASGIDAVVLVVAADEGVMPQTREHFAVCELLGIGRGVVALTKIDRVDEDVRALAIDDVRSLLGERFRAPIVPCSPPHGEGVEDVRVAIGAALSDAPDRSLGSPKMWIDRVVRVRGAGAVVTGTLVSGIVRRGDRLALATGRGGRSIIARGLHVHGRDVSEASAATRLAINVNVDADDLARGDLLIADGLAPEPTSCIDVSVRGEVRRGERVTVHVGTTSAAARVTRVDALEGARLARLVLDEPRPIAGGERHLLRASGALVGGGVVLDARPMRGMKPAARRSLAAAVFRGNARAALETLLDAHGLRPVVPNEASLALSIDEAVRRAPGLVRCGEGVVAKRSIAILAARARNLVTDHVARNPLDRGMPLASLRAELARVAGTDAAEAAIAAARAQREADDGGAIAVEGDVAIPAARTHRLPPEIAERLERCRAFVEEAGVHGLSTARAAELLDLELARLRPVLAALERDGAVVRAGDLWFSRAIVHDVRARVVAHLAAGARITVIEAKTLCGLPRKQAILLLEHLDAVGVTRRIGDARVLA